MTGILKPFSKSFVLSTTTFHMRKSIEISITKTYDRLHDPSTDEDRKIEIFETLDILHKMRKMVEDFEKANESLFKNQK